MNEYDSRLEFIENNDSYSDNTPGLYEEEYNIKINNNIKELDNLYLSRDLNKNMNNIQNSISNISNNLVPYEQQNNEHFNTNSISNNFFGNLNPSIDNFNKIDNYESYNNNYHNNYFNENNSINLLNLTDKIYEDDEHFHKGIISKKSMSNKVNSMKVNPKKKKSSKFVNKKNRKSLFIINNKKENNKENKRNNPETGLFGSVSFSCFAAGISWCFSG